MEAMVGGLCEARRIFLKDVVLLCALLPDSGVLRRKELDARMSMGMKSAQETDG